MQYVVTVTLTTHTAVSGSVVSELEKIGSVQRGTAGEHQLAATVTVEATSAWLAGAEAVTQVRGVAMGDVDALEVLTMAEHARRQREGTAPTE